MPAGPAGWGRASPSSGGAACPTRVGFEFTVEQVDPPCCMAGSAVGELEGQGVWRLYEDLGVTAVVYDWQVSTTKRWMNLLSPVARPVFEYNHDVVMRWGGEGLARRLGAQSAGGGLVAGAGALLRPAARTARASPARPGSRSRAGGPAGSSTGRA